MRETLTAGGRRRHHEQAVGGLSQADVGHVDAITAVKGVDPRTDAIEFEKVTGGKTLRSLRQDQVDLAMESRVTEAQDHRRHEASDNTAGQSNHQVCTLLFSPFEMVALIVGEDVVTSALEFSCR